MVRIEMGAIDNGLKAEVKELLVTNNIDYQIIATSLNQDPLDAVAAEGFMPSQIVKSMLVKADNEFSLVVIPLTERIDSKLLKKALGSHSTRFASADELRTILGCEPGSCHPFGLLTGIDTFVDISVSAQERIVFNGGTEQASIAMKYSDYARIAMPTVVDLMSLKTND